MTHQALLAEAVTVHFESLNVYTLDQVLFLANLRKLTSCLLTSLSCLGELLLEFLVHGEYPFALYCCLCFQIKKVP